MTCSYMHIQSHPSAIHSSTNSRNVWLMSAISVSPRDCSWTRGRRSVYSLAQPSIFEKYQLPWNASPSGMTPLNQLLFAIWECCSTKISTKNLTFQTFHKPASSTCGDFIRFVSSLAVSSLLSWTVWNTRLILLRFLRSFRLRFS